MTQPVDLTGILAGKRGLVMGVANNRSIAWGIAKAARAAGAELAFTYQGDALEKRVQAVAAQGESAPSVLPTLCAANHRFSWFASLPHGNLGILS